MSRCVAVLLIVAFGLVGCGSDQKSYDFGHDNLVYAARPLWRAAQSSPQSFDNVRSIEDACKIAFDTDPAKGGGYDSDDVVKGCADALRGKVMAMLKFVVAVLAATGDRLRDGSGGLGLRGRFHPGDQLAELLRDQLSWVRPGCAECRVPGVQDVRLRWPERGDPGGPEGLQRAGSVERGVSRDSVRDVRGARAVPAARRRNRTDLMAKAEQLERRYFGLMTEGTVTGKSTAENELAELARQAAWGG